MERQPIDDLFARRLHNAEVQPDNTTWAILQNRHGIEQARPLWRYAAVAASLLLVGTFSWWISQNRETGYKKVAATQQKLPAKTSVSSDVEQLILTEHEPSEVASTKPVNREKTEEVNRNRMVFQTQKFAASKINSKRTEIALQTVKETYRPILGSEEKQFIQTQESGQPIATTINEPMQVTPLPVAERTLIVSIFAEAPAFQSDVAEPVVISVKQNSKGRLNGFLKKVKRLKEGKTVAINTDHISKTECHGLTKLLDEVRESISNNTIDK